MKLVWRHSHSAVDLRSAPATRADIFQLPGAPLATLVLTLLSVLVGLMIAAQIQSTTQRSQPAAEDRRTVAATTIERLEAEQADLKRQIVDLRQAVAAEQQAITATKGNLGEISAALEMQKVIAGMVALRGPGIRVVFDDSGASQIPPKEDPSLYIVHEYQLRDIVNVLWGAGAEAISINGERIVAPSSIYCVGSTILINDTRTSPPYEFLVIGDPDRLAEAVNNPDNLRALRSRVKVYGLQLSVAKQKDVTVPAFTGSLDVRHVNLAADAPDRARTGRHPDAR